LTCQVIEGEPLLQEAGGMNKPLLVVVLALFSILSGVALWQHGYWGLFAPAFSSTAAAQVLADLGIALLLFLVWMWRDAARLRRNPWPWLLITLALGSFGPLLYLLTRREPAGP
jgi:Kef-type K+ transport system membrane component KefB